ncbi:uncharacterized protein LOC135397101 isoform X2 [Ornithodoros turicata]|uniref:uncharacterized protein LOC135397101 isoform X2 n=1 Tax=Ornithodoros turicata TaxID=34597 RepID=UPI0031391B1B
MASVLVAFVLVFVASLQFVTTPVCGAASCDSSGRNTCIDYDRVTYQSSRLSCSYYCQPDDGRCYKREKNGIPCLIFDRATKGKCYFGRCYTLTEYGHVRPTKYTNKKQECERGHDYMKSQKGIPYGCKYNCKKDWANHGFARAADNSQCLVLSTAAIGQCQDGVCVRR